MKSKGFTLVEIMIVVAIIALLAAIAIPNLLRARMAANESAAQATLKTLSTACETFAVQNNGAYPANLLALTAPAAGPPFLNDANILLEHGGYQYTPAWAAASYCFQAIPSNFGTSGGTSYTISTGGVWQTTPAAAALACP